VKASVTFNILDKCSNNDPELPDLHHLFKHHC
jgi:hypothetical protein